MSWRVRAVLGASFVGAGMLHFLAPGVYEEIMPPYLPLRRGLIYASGAAEISGGLGLLSERSRRASGLWLVLVLLAVWPANLQMLLDARAAGKPAWWVARAIVKCCGLGSDHAATFSSFLSTSSPITNLAPARTSGTSR